MNDIFYNPPLPPLRMRGISGIHFFESTYLLNFYWWYKEKSANKFQCSPLGRGEGVGQLINLFIC